MTLPLIFGHRGASAWRPENSLAAFALAVEQDASGIECDAHLTRDGHIVIMHDDTIDATTDGHGAVSAMTLAELRMVSVRSRNGTPVHGEKIPVLQEVLDQFGSHDITLNIEIKPTSNADLAEAVATMVSAHPSSKDVLLSSFDRKAIAYLHQHYPQLRRALLYPNTAMEGVMARLARSTQWITFAALLGCEAIHPYWQLVTPRMITIAHNYSMRVNVWTLDDIKQAKALIGMGIDGIITNDPEKMMQGLSKYQQMHHS